MDILYIVIPAYNEEANIRRVLEDWYPVVEAHDGDGRSRLVVVNDGSKDSTGAILEECAREMPLLKPLSKENGGHGAAVLYGYRYAIDQGADYIFQTDSDGQTLPEEFPPFWEDRQKYDMVIGHRKGRQDGWSRILVTKTLRLVIRLCFGVWVTDANTPYRLMKAEVLQQYLGLIPENFNLSNVLVSVIYAREKRPTLFRPITFRPRQGGVNSINIPKICKIGRQAVGDFKTINRQLAAAEASREKKDQVGRQSFRLVPEDPAEGSEKRKV